MELKEHSLPPDYKSIQLQQPQPQPTLDERAAQETRRVLRGPLAPVNNALNFVEDSVRDFVTKQDTHVKIGAGVVFLICYLIYFGFAVSLDADRATDLIYVTVFGFFCFGYWLVKKFLGKQISECCCQPIAHFCSTRKRILKWFVFLYFIVEEFFSEFY